MNSSSSNDNDFLGLPSSTAIDKMDSFVNSIPIPSESVYYAAEYLRLQSEIDNWKAKATKYQLENEDLKKEVEKQTELVTKLTKEKTEQCGGFQLGLDQLKRDNAKLTTTLKKYGTANKLYIEKYRALKSEHEKAKQVCPLYKISKENNKKYWKTLQYIANFLDKCNNQLTMCAKKLSGEIVELSPQFASQNLNEATVRMENNIKTISVKTGLNTFCNTNNLLNSSNPVQNSSNQFYSSLQNNCCMPTSNLPHSSGTNQQPEANMIMASGVANNLSNSTCHPTPVETGSSDGYHPSTSPITPDDAGNDLLPENWTSGQMFENSV